MKTMLLWSGTVLAAGLLLAGCGKPQVSVPPPSIDAVAFVDGKPITRAEFEAELAQASRRRAADPRKVLDGLVQRESLVARAQKLGLENDPAVQRSIELALIARLKELELEPRLKAVQVAEAEAEPRATTAPTDSSATPVPQVRLAILRQQLYAQSSPAKVKAAEERLVEARAKAAQLPPGSAGFGALALDYSDHEDTRLRGGDLGWLEPDPARYHFDSEAIKAGFALSQPGEMSSVVRGKDGLYLVRMIERREVSRAHSGAEPGLVRHRAYLEKRRGVEEAFAEETRRLVPTTINESVLSQVLADLAAAGTDPASAPPHPLLSSNLEAAGPR